MQLVAVVHAAAVVLMLTGGLLALRWPRLLLVHVPVTVAIFGVYLAGADCPLTTLELSLRAAAGAPSYSGGYLSHYVFSPLAVDRSSTAAQVGLHAAALVPNALAYALLAARWRRRQPVSRSQTVACPAGPASRCTSTSTR